jgi:hypothetical protein
MLSSEQYTLNQTASRMLVCTNHPSSGSCTAELTSRSGAQTPNTHNQLSSRIPLPMTTYLLSFSTEALAEPFSTPSARQISHQNYKYRTSYDNAHLYCHSLEAKSTQCLSTLLDAADEVETATARTHTPTQTQTHTHTPHCHNSTHLYGYVCYHACTFKDNASKRRVGTLKLSTHMNGTLY